MFDTFSDLLGGISVFSFPQLSSEEDKAIVSSQMWNHIKRDKEIAGDEFF